MRISLWIVLALGLAIVPSAKADSFVYNVTAEGPGLTLDVTFDLPSFENSANFITTFVSATLNGEPITNFGITGDGSECNNGFDFGLGPCWVATSTAAETFLDRFSPSFSGPGTFTASGEGFSTTVTITEVVAAPEPSSLALVPLGLVALLLMRKRAGHVRPSAI